MSLPVSLRELVEELQALLDEDCVYVNRHTGEVYHVFGEELGFGENRYDPSRQPDWLADELPKIREVEQSDDWVAMPTKFDIHEYQIMERFSYSLEDEDASRRLENAIRGRGAFRRFKKTVEELGIRDDWFRYRDARIGEMVAGLLEVEDIPFVRDLDQARGT